MRTIISLFGTAIIGLLVFIFASDRIDPGYTAMVTVFAGFIILGTRR